MCYRGNMILKIEQVGHATLRKPAKPLTAQQLASPNIQQLIDLMIATLRDKPGVGLAAPQVGEPLQIIIIEDKKKYLQKVPEPVLAAQRRKPVSLHVIVNPTVTVLDTATDNFFEGCLSVDGFRAVVPRARRVRVSGLDRHGKRITVDADGWLARIVQHEVDHLGGTVYIDRMYSRTYMTEKAFAADWLSALPAEIDTLIGA